MSANDSVNNPGNGRSERLVPATVSAMSDTDISDTEVLDTKVLNSGDTDVIVDPWDVDPDGGLLPGWYMPAAGGVSLTGWRRAVALVIVVAFFAITAYGLCSTYGQISFL